MIPTTVKTDQVSQQLQARNVTAIQPVSPVKPVTVVADPGDTQNTFIQGQKYKVLVENRLSNGDFNVLISNKHFKMHLPENTLPGDKLDLLFLTANPKLKFALENVNSTLLPRNNATISQTGQFLDVLVNNTEKTNIPSFENLTPILSASSINKKELPALLQKAILQSGLFYESHLAKWVNGKITLEQIQQEPQNQLKISVSNSSATVGSTQITVPINSQSLSLVQQQLMTLETGQIVWRGEFLNGQKMQCTIYEEESDARNNQVVNKRWKTELTLNFPELGKIVATIALNAQNIQIKLNADSDETVQLLKHSQPALKQNIHTSGLTVDSFELNSND